MPKYVNLFTTFSLWPLAMTQGSMYRFPGADWCIISVFLILMVRPKSLHASENLSSLRCMSSSDPAFRAQSSANRGSDDVCHDLGFCLKPTVVEQPSVCSVSDADSNVIISKGIHQHGGEH